jgi:sugar phosphate permease
MFYGWWVVAACFALIMWAAGTCFYGISVFFNPIREEFMWGAALTSVAFAIRGMESGVADFGVGFILDRFGPRRVAQTGLLIMGIGWIALSLVNSLWLFYTAVAVIALGFSGCGGVVVMSTVSHWFVKKRGRAMGMTMAGAGAGGLLVPVMAFSIDVGGWRTTAILLGVISWALAIPLSMLLKHKPEQYGYLPDGASQPQALKQSTLMAQGNIEEPTRREFGLMEAMKTRAFWLVALAYASIMVGLNGLVPHFIPFLTSEDVGFSTQKAALLLTLMTISSISGRLGLGWLGDQVPKRYLLIAIFTIQTTAVIILAFSDGHLWQVLLFVLMFGPCHGGSVAMWPAINGDYFGRHALASIIGTNLGLASITGIISPIFTGALFDATGSYHLAITGLGLVMALSIPMIFLARPPSRANLA